MKKRGDSRLNGEMRLSVNENGRNLFNRCSRYGRQEQKKTI